MPRQRPPEPNGRLPGAIVRLLAVLLIQVATCAHATERIWVDTDAACDGQDRSDVDDCWAIALLARTPGVEIVGISTVFGNAPEARVHGATRMLVRQLGGRTAMPIWRGASAPVRVRQERDLARVDEGLPADQATRAVDGLRHALSRGRFRVVALGPLTNIAHLLQTDPAAARNITEVLAVMGKREGHVFHPAEDARAKAWLGHGPVFTDMNVRLDPAAAAAVLYGDLPLRLFPYELARQVTLRPETVARQAPLGRWLAGRSRLWADYWRSAMGREGFYPFDVLAAAYVLAPAAYSCPLQQARVAADTRIGLFGGGPLSLLVGTTKAPSRRVRYCTRVRSATIGSLWTRLR